MSGAAGGGMLTQGEWASGFKFPAGYDGLSQDKQAELKALAWSVYRANLNPHRPDSYSSKSAASFRARRAIKTAMGKGKRHGR